jgi:signal transduction histidine kinase
MRSDGLEWPTRIRWIVIAWVLFAVANLAAMLLLADWETVPFHFIWVSLTLLYGFQVWKVRPTLGVLAAVMIFTGGCIWIDVTRGFQPLDEITEVPLMAAMFLAMVWHAQRRLNAMEESERVSMENLRLLERERRFVQDASHELRTPITIALGHAELIQRQTDSPTVAEDAAVITDELMRLRHLADRLLLLAGSEDPEFLAPQPVDADTVVLDAVHRWGATPRQWRIAGLDEAIIMADTGRLAVALDALIDNAVRHTKEGDPIELGVKAGDDDVTISVSDAGTGIPAVDLDHIFDRFARADQGRSRETGGFGLGLSIVTAIVQAHDGTVGVRSAEGLGTTFEITLPRFADPGREVVEPGGGTETEREPAIVKEEEGAGA